MKDYSNIDWGGGRRNTKVMDWEKFRTGNPQDMGMVKDREVPGRLPRLLALMTREKVVSLQDSDVWKTTRFEMMMSLTWRYWIWGAGESRQLDNVVWGPEWGSWWRKWSQASQTQWDPSAKKTDWEERNLEGCRHFSTLHVKTPRLTEEQWLPQQLQSARKSRRQRKE